MPDAVAPKTPLPNLVSFLPCHEIFHDSHKDTPIAIGPINRGFMRQFPGHIKLSFLFEFTGCHGRYWPQLQLKDEQDQVVWGWTSPQPFEQNNPLVTHQHTVLDLPVAVPRSGRYFFVLLMNEQIMTQRAIWITPPKPPKSSEPD
jgi:hypothetical protein